MSAEKSDRQPPEATVPSPTPSEDTLRLDADGPPVDGEGGPTPSETEAVVEQVLAETDFAVESDAMFSGADCSDRPADPAAVAAELMVAAALAARPGLAEAAGREGACVALRAPSAVWCTPVCLAWRKLVLGEDLSGPAGRAAALRQRGELHEEIRHEAGARGARARADDIESLQRALWLGRGALGVAPDPSLLSPELLQAADHTVEIPPLDALGLRLLAERLCGGSAPPPDPLVAAGMTPTSLRLARRPGQAAADYLERVARLVAAERPAPPPPPRWTLDTLPLPEEVARFFRGTAADLRAYASGTLDWADVDKGALLYGPPGCGKTTAAAALAASAGVRLVATSYSEWQSAGREGHLGELVKCLRARFAEARAAAPCVLFIDEIDSVRGRGMSSRHDDWWTAINNALLEELDGLAGRREGVFVLAATNRPDMVDPAVRRAGRLDQELRLSLPDAPTLARIFAAHLTALAGADLAPAAMAALGASGADCERWARGARRRARRAGRSVTVEHLTAEIRGAVERRPPAVARRVAYHEAGHAVVTALQRPPGALICVSTRPAAGTAGGVSSRAFRGEDTDAEVGALLRELLAGRAAEELVFGTAGGGSGGPAHSDLAQATVIAASAELAWGLGGALTWRGDPDAGSLPALLAASPGAAENVEARLRAALDGAREMLRRHRRALDAVAAALLERETLSGEEAEFLVGRALMEVRAPAAVVRPPQLEAEGVAVPGGTP